MDLLNFIWDNLDLILDKTIEHISLVGIAVGLALLAGVPIGIAITQNQKSASIVLYTASIIITIPSVALFGIMIPLLSPFGHGIGPVPAMIAVLLYSLLPIIRNTYIAINNIDPALREAARGMGMRPLERLRLLEIPLAMPVIMAGVRTAVVMNIGVMTIATFIGAGGLGDFISSGITQSDQLQLMTGALAVSILAVIADYCLLFIQNKLTPAGIKL
ncbi:ABC transporter permease [Amphritea opalescens]|uniref:ABC transporter permease n=1 Tax=Amphritea opalescens TaxID=2490544 RepID=A0A430KUY2_9GAMM|nr:ABC transporter permease [Amphritea opalescens]RTE67307.1 ABC transporter permease [Amphritea opalescens]